MRHSKLEEWKRVAASKDASLSISLEATNNHRANRLCPIAAAMRALKIAYEATKKKIHCWYHQG